MVYVVVKVGDGEYDTATCYGMGFVVGSSAELALVPGAFEDGRADFGVPVGGVFGIVTGHELAFLWYTTVNPKN